MPIEYALLKKPTNNFALAKTVSVYLMVIIIPIVFYSYTAITGKSVLIIDISTFIFAAIIGQSGTSKENLVSDNSRGSGFCPIWPMEDSPHLCQGFHTVRLQIGISIIPFVIATMVSYS